MCQRNQKFSACVSFSKCHWKKLFLTAENLFDGRASLIIQWRKPVSGDAENPLVKRQQKMQAVGASKSRQIITRTGALVVRQNHHPKKTDNKGKFKRYQTLQGVAEKRTIVNFRRRPLAWQISKLRKQGDKISHTWNWENFRPIPTRPQVL